MTLQQLYYCLTISQIGSMNKAAEKLFISQPTLTSAIKELEKEIGIQIFLRTGKGVVATSEGEEFLLYARQLYQQYELLRIKYDTKGNIKRHFGVSCQHYSFAIKAFVETVKKFDTSEYDFAIRETKTLDVIEDVGHMKSEIGILYMSDFNQKILQKMWNEHELEFIPLVECHAYVYLWKNHPLAKQTSISFEELSDYPCLSFEQGDKGSLYLTEEILSDKEYPRTIKTNDRATMLNLMAGLNAYTLCSGIICEELNSGDYVVVPFKEDEESPNTTMTVGLLVKKNSTRSEVGKTYIEQVRKYLQHEEGFLDI